MMEADLNRLICLLTFVALLTCAATRAKAGDPDKELLPVRGFIGSTSCSARACHGSMTAESSRVERNEFTVWLTRDRHSDAYASLFKPLAKQIARRRGQKAAHEDTACLACHAPASVANRSLVDRPSEPREGVGCEACHGPAGSWIGAHTDPGWRERSPQWKRERGFAPLTTTADVAGQCSSCHVGARGLPMADRDVTHDMIAAGHPRLMFEFSSYLAHMPRHWSEETNGRFTGSPDRAWLCGQLVSLRCTTELTVSRAAGPQKAWPDLSEFDCFSCHHSWRSNTMSRDPEVHETQASATVGGMVYQTWYAAVPLRLVQVRGMQCPADMVTAFTRMEQVMSTPRPRAAEAINAGRLLIRALKEWQTTSAEVPSQLMLSHLARASVSRPITHWDEAEEIYLGLSALGRAHPERFAVLELSRMSDLLGTGPNQPGRMYDPAPIRAEISRIANMIAPPPR
jgi:hypothetical protein